MKRRHEKTPLYLLAMLVVASVGYADEHITIFTEQFPPYNYLENDIPTGINLEISEQLCLAANIDCVFVFQPWARSYSNALTSPMSGLVSTSKTKARTPLFQWVGPLVSSDNYLYRLRDKPQVNLTSLADVTQFSISAPENDVYIDVLQELGYVRGKNLFVTRTKYEGARLFFAGKIDLLIANPLTMPYQFEGHNFDLNMVEQLIPLPLERLEGNYLALNHEVPKDTVALMRAALKKMRAHGHIDKLVAQYYRDVRP